MNINQANETFCIHQQDIPIPSIQSRDFHGYYQYLDTSERNGSRTQQWRFVVWGFSICGTKAIICKWDNTFETVPVDSHGNIIVIGNRYSDQHWSC